LLGILLATGPAASAATVVVPGTANPYLAGMPDGTPADITDIASFNSPALAGIALPMGGWLEFTNARGAVANSHLPSGSTDYDWTAGPEGTLQYIPWHRVGAEHGKSNVTAPLVALMGVFLSDDVLGELVPDTLQFDTLTARDYLTLAPELNQIFFIGNGLTSALQQQKIFIPDGATRLFLGVMDGYNWNNNLGAFEVDVNSVVPEPATAALLGLGAVAVLVRRRHLAAK